jgi:hypothetical protein
MEDGVKPCKLEQTREQGNIDAISTAQFSLWQPLHRNFAGVK